MESEYERVRALLPKLTKPQFDCLSRVYVGDDMRDTARTVSVLIRHRLIEPYVRMSGVARFRATSNAAHLAWCSYIAELPTDGVVQ